MTETTTQSQPETPKKSSLGKKLFYVIALVLGLLGIDHYTYNFVSGGVAVTVTDSAIVVAPSVDTTTVVPAVVVDTTKK